MTVKTKQPPRWVAAFFVPLPPCGGSSTGPTLFHLHVARAFCPC